MEHATDHFTRDFERLTQAADILRTMAHPVRLCILRGLLDRGSCNVSKMQGCLNLPQSTVSQHLAKLRAAGLVVGERNGTEVIYRVKNQLAERIIHLFLEWETPQA